MENPNRPGPDGLEQKLTEILADHHVHEVLNEWLTAHISGAMVGALKEPAGLDDLVQSLSFRGRCNVLGELRDEIEALHEKGQNELKNQ